MATQSGYMVASTLQAAGLSLALTTDHSLKIAPASNLTPELRELIRSNKPALVQWLTTPPANDPAPDAALDPDRWCWPCSPAMNTAEIDRFTARLARFTDHGVIQGDAECLADRLVIRDREQDDRALCLECTHLHRAGRCGNWQRAGVAIRSRDAFMPLELVRLLQRCDGFTQSIHFQGGNHGQA